MPVMISSGGVAAVDNTMLQLVNEAQLHALQPNATKLHLVAKHQHGFCEAASAGSCGGSPRVC